MGRSSENERSSRNGQWIIEVRNGFLTDTGGVNTGSSILFGDGSSQMSIGLNTKRFVSNNSAIMVNISIISFCSDSLASLNTLMAGGNFYINDNLPLALSGVVVMG